MNIIEILKQPVTDDLLRKMGFSDYDDEHCNWGNRRLMVADHGKWPDECYKLQIIDQEEDLISMQGYGEDYIQEEGFFYSGWFELLPEWRTKDHWQIHTVRDIYKIIYLYHREYIADFIILLKNRFDATNTD